MLKDRVKIVNTFIDSQINCHFIQMDQVIIIDDNKSIIDKLKEENERLKQMNQVLNQEKQ